MSKPGCVFKPLCIAAFFRALHVISYSEARNSLKSGLDKVVYEVDVTIINRHDVANAVVMSLDHYNSLMETLHLLQNPANAAHLAESIARFKAGKAEPKMLIQE